MRGKSYLLATVSSLALFGAVQMAAAADLPARAPVKAPVAVAAPFNWTGFYIGVHGGGAWLDHKQTTFQSNSACAAPFNTTSVCELDRFGGAFGGLAGYNFQSGRVVYGLEVDGSWLGVKTSASYPDIVALSGTTVTLTGNVDWLATVRGRIGLTMSPTLLYVTGGAAFGGVKSSWLTDAPGEGVTVDKTKVGWVVGGGIEHAFAAQWTARVEALFHDLGKVSGSFASAGQTYSTTFHHRVTTVRGALALRW
jgi:outer membrane immunogenic protein